MKIDIKNISISSLILSALPLAIFAVTLVGVFLDLFAPRTEPFFQVLLSSLFWAITQTLITMLVIVVGAFIYNLLCSIGLRGVRINLEDVEENKGE